MKQLLSARNYKNKISIDKIDGIIGKIKDMPTKLTAIFATTQGYQKGAKEKAQKNGVQLLIVRKQKRIRLACKRWHPIPQRGAC